MTLEASATRFSLRARNAARRGFTVVAGVAGAVANCVANGQAQSGAQVEPIEEIVVIGSHLRRTDLDGPAPVVVLNREDLDRSGYNTLSDLARNLPYNTGTRSEEFTGTTTGAPGANSFNLRSLGAQNTLTVVNGRRVAPYGSSLGDRDTFVDINSIPIAAIERIEVLKDGASAIYGSDAVAGVVNVVLKEHYEGVVLDVGALSTSRHDGEEFSASLTAGKDWTRTGALFTASFLRREPVWSVDREHLADADLTRQGGFDFRSFFSTPPTLFRVDRGRVVPDPACPIEGPVAHQQLPLNNPLIDGFCRLNFRPYMAAIPEAERAGITAALTRELTDSTNLKVDLIVNRNESVAQLPPAFTDITPLPPPFPLVLADHPNNPFGSAVWLNYRVADAGPRISKAESLSTRISAVVEGEIGSWQWSAHALSSLSDVDTDAINNVDSVLFQEALLGQGGANGDQYYNPFALDPVNDPGVIAAFSVPVSTRSEERAEWLAEFQVNREFGNLPGGEMGVALGAQFRNQRLDSIGDEFQTSGIGLGVSALRPLNADRDISSVYAELALPLLPAVELQVAARLEDYSDFGRDLNPKLAVRWQATEGLAFRASYATSFRAPTFKELFRSPDFFLAFVRDSRRCAATNTAFDCGAVPVNVERGGNSELNPEEGESFFAGLIWSPTATPELRVTMDLWRFDHTERIVSAPTRFIVDNFGNDPALVQRGPPLPGDPPGAPGPIALVRQIDINLDRLVTDGVDLGFDYRVDAGRWGGFATNLVATYLNDYSFRNTVVAERVGANLAGAAELSRELPHWRAVSSLHWQKGRQGLSATLRYSGGYRSPTNLVIDALETETPFNVGSHITLDLQYQLNFPRLNEATLRIGCQNCLDQLPPDDNYIVGSTALHDPRGAIVYMRWMQPFAAP